MEEGRHLGRCWEILRLWEDTAEIILGAVELGGSQQLDEDKSPEKCTCFSVLQVHENPRWDNEWPDRPPRAPWIPGTGWTNIPRRWVLGGEARTQEQYLRLPLSLKTTQDLKHLNRQKWCWQESKGEKASLDLCTTSLFLQSLPWVFSFFLVCFSFGVFLSFFFPNKHAVWLSLSYIGQDIRLRSFFFGFLFLEGFPMEIECSYFLCKSHDTTPHKQ